MKKGYIVIWVNGDQILINSEKKLPIYSGEIKNILAKRFQLTVVSGAEFVFRIKTKLVDNGRYDGFIYIENQSLKKNDFLARVRLKNKPKNDKALKEILELLESLSVI